MKGKEYLTKSEQYALVHHEGRSWARSLMVVKVLPNGLDLPRYGFSVSKRVGGAVTRNRVKRRLREILRRAPLKPGWDIIFIARPDIAMANYAEVRESALHLLSQARLLVEDYEGVCLSLN